MSYFATYICFWAVKQISYDRKFSRLPFKITLGLKSLLMFTVHGTCE